MSETKHTQGPFYGGNEVINDSKGRLLAIVQYRGVSPGCEIPIEEGKANSALFAAAPELLEAAKTAALHFEAMTVKQRTYNIHAFEKLKDAIAKAEGESVAVATEK